MYTCHTAVSESGSVTSTKTETQPYIPQSRRRPRATFNFVTGGGGVLCFQAVGSGQETLGPALNQGFTYQFAESPPRSLRQVARGQLRGRLAVLDVGLDAPDRLEGELARRDPDMLVALRPRGGQVFAEIPCGRKWEARESTLLLRLLSNISALMLMWAIHILLVRGDKPYHAIPRLGLSRHAKLQTGAVTSRRTYKHISAYMHTRCVQQMASPTNTRALDTPPRARYTL